MSFITMALSVDGGKPSSSRFSAVVPGSGSKDTQTMEEVLKV